MAKLNVTLKDIATYTGLTYQSVSKILNGSDAFAKETAERVRRAAEELGYRANVQGRNLRRRKSHLICYSSRLLSQYAYRDGHNAVLEQLLSELSVAAQKRGYHILNTPIPQGEQLTDRISYLLRSGQVDGLIIAGIERTDSRIRYLARTHFPFVSFGRTVGREPEYSYVDVDGKTGIALATRHTIDVGCRRLAAVTWHTQSRLAEERLEGFRRAVAEGGPSVRAVAEITASEDPGERAAQIRDILAPSEDRPDALICASDALAISVINVAASLGLRVGVDISVTGFDDLPLSQYLHPPLTTVCQPLHQAAEHLLDTLIEMIEGNHEPRGTVLLPDLIVRESTRRAP